MLVAATKPFVTTVTPRKTSRRLCRPWLAVVLVILLAIQAVLAPGAWEYAYARLLIPDVIFTEAGLATPPLVTVRDHYIVSYEPPAGPRDDPNQ